MTIRIERYRATSANAGKNNTPLFRQPYNGHILEHDDAQHLIKNIKLGMLSRLICNTLDFITPYTKKYPHFDNIVAKYSEKMLRIAGKL